MCIPKGCQNKEGAEAFINFLCRPDVSAANLDYIGYSTPETAAKEYMDEEVIESPVSYPDDETLARSESFAALGVEATQVMNDLWLSVKNSTSNTTLYLIPVSYTHLQQHSALQSIIVRWILYRIIAGKSNTFS